MIEKENPISLNRFHSADKMDNYSTVGEVGKIREKEKKNPEATIEQVRV